MHVGWDIHVRFVPGNTITCTRLLGVSGIPPVRCTELIYSVSAWASQRWIVIEVIGEHLWLPTVLHTMVVSSKCFTFLCEDDIAQKEAAERIRNEYFYSNLILYLATHAAFSGD